MTHSPNARRPPLPDATARPLRIASYNVHGCVGLDGRRDPGRIARVIREIGADVLALQEVSADGAGADTDQFELLADALGLEVVEGPSLRSAAGRFGNALLTRLPLRDVRRLDLSVPRCEARGALSAEVTWGAARVRIVTTHLGLGRGERRHQVERLLAWLDAESERAQPTVLAGDINEWLRGSRVLRRIARRFGHAPSARSFPSRRPMLRLDRVWATPDAALARVQAHRSALARIASDHLPVWADLDLRALATPLEPPGSG